MPVEIKNLSHVYSEGSPFEFQALKDIDITIEDGSFVGIIGHTGSGKSTLIQHLNGLLTPTSGTVLVDGEDIFSKKKNELIQLRHHIGLVFQYPEHQLFEETVHKDVAFGPKNQGLSEDEINQRVQQSIKMVGLNYDDVKDKSPFELSGGQMRRVAIAGVLAMEPSVLILDEPTAGLDPRGREEILAQIKYLHKKKKMTVILVSHSMEDIGRLVEKILVMNAGEVVFYDSPNRVFTEIETLERIGLAVPEVTYLMRKLKEKYPEIREDIFTVAAAKDEILKVIRG
ncbi:energy-coupling factor transporter ATPase [Acetobacterium fimetarium]|uniref:Energy-coupling factor transporter ATP-binding protein EcfA2 n=1 Tax=Acetobacterium fimetarium TaxID=52691 RepID=A0ABR6WT22_9FIRM|nr:energy-coupling factor transporter ATPase [Acetobacterium fimetarium]MBC3803764.1 energy-coupling factor transporter ATPase [Acetobacterium fimetarium]